MPNLTTKHTADLIVARHEHRLTGLVHAREQVEASCVACPWETTTTTHPGAEDRIEADYQLHIKLLVAAKNDRVRNRAAAKRAALRSNEKGSTNAE